MKIILVGNRDGKAVINWPGVLAATLFCVVLATVGAAAFMIAFRLFSLVSLVFAPVFGISMVGTWVLLSLRLPVEKLTRLE